MEFVSPLVNVFYAHYEQQVQMQPIRLLPTKPINRILIVRLGAIGDVIHTLHVLEPLRARFPSSHIAWLVEDKARDILMNNPLLDEVIVFPRKELQREIKRFRTFHIALSEGSHFFRALRRRNFDLVLDFQGNLRSGLMTFLTSAPIRVGFGPGFCKEFNYLFTNRRVFPKAQRIHRVEKYLSMAQSLGADKSNSKVVIEISQNDLQYISNFLSQRNRRTEPMVIIHPATSDFGAFKRWPTHKYAAVANKLIEEFGAWVVVTWGPGERHLAQEVVSQTNNKARLCCETTSIKQLAAVIKESDLFIAADTGPLHLAAALGIPVVAIFGPKDPVIYKPYSDKCVVVRKDLPCAPCKRRTCDALDCIHAIEVEDVLNAAKQIITIETTAHE